ncbi:MAG TPA: hypothetical protein VN644_03210 [Pyrinomonadaceae bacterium]|nr:hypothetical protein [Pyrinomonadaceae bacterium]
MINRALAPGTSGSGLRIEGGSMPLRTLSSSGLTPARVIWTSTFSPSSSGRGICSICSFPCHQIRDTALRASSSPDGIPAFYPGLQPTSEWSYVRDSLPLECERHTGARGLVWSRAVKHQSPAMR